MSTKNGNKLRSQEWWGQPNYESFTRRAWMRSEGFSSDFFQNKPVIGICNSWSEFNNCNAHLRTVAEAVKRGVLAAGGFPLEFPTISLGEVYMKPTTMLFRNLMAMDVEECIRAYPMDAVVLLCGCDKTTPAQLMGAASADVPAIVVPGGPMLSGQWKDRKLGSGTDGRKLFDLFRTGRLSEEQWCEIECGISRSAGHCTVMGTASTMTSLAEALGMTLTGSTNIPAADSRRLTIAEMSGRRAVELALEDVRPSQILTRQAIENAITVDMAIGGSANAVVHLIAIAGRLGIDLHLDDFDAISRRTPYVANVKPSGEFLMEDFFYAGGLPVVMKEILHLLHGDAMTVMKNCGPKGAPGFPEWGHIPMPKVLLEQGVSDMVRISDARMSGTSFGTVVLHAAPESALGGPLAVVRNGDEVQLNVAGRQIELCVPGQEIQRRLQNFTPAPPKYDRGYGRMFL